MKFSTIKNILLVGFILFFIYQLKDCKNPKKGETIKVDGKKYELVKHIIDTQEVVKYKVKYKQGKDIYHDTTIYVQIPVDKPVDTLSILKDFFAKNVYNDTLFLPDNLGTVLLFDTISKNKIEGRRFIANVKQRIITDTKIVKELPKTKVFVGVEGGFNKADVVSHLGTGVMINTKNDKLFHLGVGVANRTIDGTNGKFSPYVGAGVYWKIRLKK